MSSMAPQLSGRFFLAASSVFLGAATVAALLRAPDPLVRVQSETRSIEGRVAAFDHRPLRSESSMSGSISSRQLGALAELQEIFRRDRTSSSAHRLAIAELAVGMVDAAYEHLAEATRLQPNAPALLSDLASAELSLGRIADAAEHSAIARERDPAQASAAFNWALALEKLANRDAAMLAWQDFLAMEPAGGWSDEARERVARLRRPRPEWDKDSEFLVPGATLETIRRVHALYPQRTRTHVQNILLPKWVSTGGDEHGLALMRALGAERKTAGDPFLADLVEQAAARRNEITAGMRTYSRAYEAARSIDPEAAAVAYGEAANLLDKAGSPLAIAASILAASNDSYRKRYDDALRRLDAIDRKLAAEGNRYPALLAEASWTRGLILMQTGHPEECLEAFRRGVAEAKKAGESETEVAIAQLMATQLEIVGDQEEADLARLANLRRCDEINPHPRRMFTALAETALSALRAGRPRVALAFVESQWRLALREENVLFKAETEAERAMALLDIGRLDRAEVAVEDARAQALLVNAEAFRERVQAIIEFTAGRVERQRRRPARAVEAFSAAIAVWEKNGWHIHLASSYLARAEARLAAGDASGAEQDLKNGVAEMEEQRESSEPAMRVAYFERADRVFEKLIELLLDGGREKEALSYVERKRARFLLDQLAGPDTRSVPLSAEEIARSVHDRTVIVELALLERDVAIWVVGNGQIGHARSQASRTAIEAAASRHLSAIASDDVAAVRREGRWLFDQLIAPIAGQLPAGADLVIVPDGPFLAFPFSTLVAPDGRFLIEKHALAAAPSATVFLRTAPAATRLSILAVTQPAPEGYVALPGAASEVKDIAALYSRGRMLSGPEIDPEGFLKSAGEVTVVHFAGHGKTDVRHPSRSALLFESAAGPPASLTAATIARTRLHSHPLVVLAACSTARGRVFRNEGIDGLPSAFLQAGARGVVATLWDIDDGASARLFRALHRELRKGGRPADALREAQLEFLGSSDPRERSPAVWGSPIVVGEL